METTPDKKLSINEDGLVLYQSASNRLTCPIDLPSKMSIFCVLIEYQIQVEKVIGEKKREYFCRKERMSHKLQLLVSFEVTMKTLFSLDFTATSFCVSQQVRHGTTWLFVLPPSPTNPHLKIIFLVNFVNACLVSLKCQGFKHL